MPVITKTTAGLNLLRDGDRGTASVKITYFSIGSGSATPAATDTKLQNETFRKTIASYTTGVDGEVTVAGVLANADAAGANIQEVGFWGGNASSTLNSGTLIARGLYAHNPKLSTESITFTCDITYS
jgi:hypothetical protein